MVKKIIITMICVLTVVALSVFTCFGWTLIRAEVYGVEYGTQESASYHVCKFMLSSGGGQGYRVGVYTDGTQYAPITRMRMYFYVDTDKISSFYIVLNDATFTPSSENLGVYLCKLTASGSITDYTNIGTSVKKVFTDQGNYTEWSWLYDGQTYNDKNIIILYLPIGAGSIGPSVCWFDIKEFSVNGVPVSDIKAYSNYELLESVSEAMDIGLVPDPGAIVTSTNNIVGYYSDLGPVMLDTYMNNTLIAPMLIITFTVGAAAYILFGKKA